MIQVAPPQELYDHPADAFVASFVGRANLIDATVLAPDVVDSPLGRLMTPLHGLPIGAAARLLVRPEKVEPSQSATGENTFPATVLHDRFFGASREIELSIGQSILKIDTNSREAISCVHLPRKAIQFLPTH